MGQAAAETLQVSDKGSKKVILLFASMAAAGIFTYLRDWKMVISSTLISARTAVYGSMMGIWLSPMLMSIGYPQGEPRCPKRPPLEEICFFDHITESEKENHE